MNNAKWFLSSYKRCRRRVDDLLDQIAEINAQATKVTQIMRDDGSSGTRRTDGLASTIARLMDKKDELQAEIDEMMQQQQTVEDTIKRVGNSMQKQVLHKRYVLCQGYEQIAEDMGITERYAFKLHGFGLLAVQAIREREESGK